MNENLSNVQMFFSKADILIVRHRQDVMLRFWNTGSGVHQTSDGNTFLKSMSISAFLFFLSPQILGENCALTTQRRRRRARCSSLRGCGRAGVDWKADGATLTVLKAALCRTMCRAACLAQRRAARRLPGCTGG